MPNGSKHRKRYVTCAPANLRSEGPESRSSLKLTMIFHPPSPVFMIVKLRIVTLGNFEDHRGEWK